MSTVTLSSRYRMVIPKAIRTSLHLAAGDTVHMMAYGGRIHIIPTRSMESMRGFLKRPGLEPDRMIGRENDPN